MNVLKAGSLVPPELVEEARGLTGRQSQVKRWKFAQVALGEKSRGGGGGEKGWADARGRTGDFGGGRNGGEGGRRRG